MKTLTLSFRDVYGKLLEKRIVSVSAIEEKEPAFTFPLGAAQVTLSMQDDAVADSMEKGCDEDLSRCNCQLHQRLGGYQ